MQSPNIVAFAFGAAVVGIANFQIRIFFAPDLMPPTVQVVTQRASAYLPKAVLFRDVFGFEDNVCPPAPEGGVESVLLSGCIAIFWVGRFCV